MTFPPPQPSRLLYSPERKGGEEIKLKYAVSTPALISLSYNNEGYVAS